MVGILWRRGRHLCYFKVLNAGSIQTQGGFREMRHLDGKRALITGAASGIGRAIALQLAGHGVDLCLWDRDRERLGETTELVRQAGVDSISMLCDLSSPEQIGSATRRLLADWPPIDLLINNAGVGCEGPTHQMTSQEWESVMSINLMAPVRIIHLLLPTLLSRPQAHLLNVCSFLGLCPVPRGAAYCSSKFGLVGLTECLRMEYRRTPLGVTALCPGFVRTRLFEHGQGGDTSKPVRKPASVLFTTPETVARRAVHGIRRNRAKVVITPLAHSSWRIHRYLPGLLELASLIGRRKGPLMDSELLAGSDLERAA